MASFGGFGSFPFTLGGEPNEEEEIFYALRKMEGDGAYPSSDPDGADSLEGAWLSAIAAGLAAIASVEQAAIWQAFPDTVTDYLPEYERMLFINPPVNSPDEERRQVIIDRIVTAIESDLPSIQDLLTEIDERFVVQTPDRTIKREVRYGKAYDSLDYLLGSGTYMNGRTHTNFPNYSDDYVVTVLFDIGSGLTADGELGRLKARGEALLQEVLPAWNDFRVVLDIGFILDQSLLDVTAFGS